MIRKITKRLRAYAFLGFSLLLNLLRRPFRKTGIAKFEAQYSADGLFRLSQAERANVSRFSRCISCGLCDLYCAGLAGAPRRMPRALAIAGSRSLADYDALAGEAKAWLGCESCGACEAACPTGVPLRELAAFVEVHAPRTARGGASKGSESRG
jgi:succinate dehydrogenase/fumarate reductase-like Fe-S protein